MRAGCHDGVGEVRRGPLISRKKIIQTVTRPTSISMTTAICKSVISGPRLGHLRHTGGTLLIRKGCRCSNSDDIASSLEKTEAQV